MDDEVVINFVSDVYQAVAGIEDLSEKAEALALIAKIAQAAVSDIGGDTTKIAAAAAEIADLSHEILGTGLAGQEAAIMGSTAMDEYAGAISKTAEAAAIAEAFIDDQAKAMDKMGLSAAFAKGSVFALNASIAENSVLATVDAAAKGDLGKAMFTAGAGAATLAAAQGAANNQMRIGIGWWAVTGTQLHWIIAGSAELLAVLVPATVAAAAWAFVWVQGATNVYTHLKAVFTATEALGQATGQTYGEMLGLNGQWQKFQNMANVGVYQALGSALLVLKEHFSDLAQVGYQVGQVFDTFAAKLVVDFSKAGWAGTTMDELLKDMIPDLIEVGQFFGNLGHAIALFAAQMPGLAEVLLMLFAQFTHLLVVVFTLTDHLGTAGFTVLTVAMAFEEFNRWGGLVNNMLGRMGLQVDEVAGGFFTFERFSGTFLSLFMVLPRLIGTVSIALGTMVGRMAGISGVFGTAGAGITRFGTSLELAAGGLTFFQAVAVVGVAIGLGIMIDKLETAQSAAQKFADSLNEIATKASNTQVLNVLANNVGLLQTQLKGATAQENQWNDAIGKTLPAGREAGAVTEYMRSQQQAYSSAIQTTISNIQIVSEHALQLANIYHTNLVGAEELATMAGVNFMNTMSPSKWIIALAQVASLAKGFAAMGTGAGAVGNDTAMLGIQSALAGTKVQQLNSAISDFMTNVTSGTQLAGEFENSISQIGDVAATAKENLGKVTNIDLTTSEFAKSLKSFTGNGAQAWQNFDQIVGSTAPQIIQWFNTAGAETGMSGKIFTNAVLEMEKQLVPFAGANKTAQAELIALANSAGLNIKSFPQLTADIKDGKVNASDLSNAINQATIAMSNMNQVAIQLGADVQNDIISQLGQSIIKSQGFNTQLNNLVHAVQTFGANSPQASGALKTISSMLQNAGIHGTQLKSILQGIQQYIDQMHGTTIVNHIDTEVSGGTPGTGTAGIHPLPQHASGGFVSGRGSSRSDSNLAWVSHGEFIMQAAAVQHYGTAFMHAVNNAKYAGGGFTGGVPGGAGTGAMNVTIHVDSYLDGAKVNTNTRTQTLIYNRRNPSNNLALRVR